jgi:hypothetical protein
MITMVQLMAMAMKTSPAGTKMATWEVLQRRIPMGIKMGMNTMNHLM